MSSVAFGQSLADAARQNRLNRDANAPKAKKVIASDDLSPNPYTDVGSDFTAEKWTRLILTEKRSVAYFQALADLLNAPVQGFAMSGQSRDAQATKLNEQLIKEKAKLELMQEAARQAGMPNTVYDPKIPVRFNRSSAGAERALRMLNSQH
jgi:hypothetical protein